ncbi:hypothetical protein [Caenimonas aquaedulcis]|uniref:DUF4034 domain-containing protein n=1 Tax=Caenimonas aquaedulcis TaxID=2793270 RepID=A0A931MG75_9BURK|nr:hypothetical protein [Caenimonas aquaedulcis]MBG9387050.1 hypothetical protein [Caenimonas aquaedulcis]
MFRSWIVMLFACCAMGAHAGESEMRKALGVEFDSAFQRGDFAAIEARYARALGSRERMPSGVFVTSQMVYLMFRSLPKTVEAKGNDAYWKPIEDQAHKWFAQYPKSTIAAIALSKAYSEHGWDYRGTGYASTVGKEDWAKLKDYLAKAGVALSSRAEEGRRDPTWRWQMLHLGRLAGWPDDKYREFAQASLEEFPGYYDTYFEIAEAMLPQWGGSMQQLAAFADYAADRTKKTDGKALFARIYWSMHGYLGPSGLSQPEVDWPSIRAGFDDLVKRYPDPWNLNYYARIACDVGDKATTRRVLTAVGERVDPMAWETRANWMRCKRWAEG